MRERGEHLRAIRLDSGDLDALSRDARSLLDDAGLGGVQIFASGGLDEDDIERLVAAGAPIDAFGVGTDLVVSRDRPALDIAYKLVSYDGRAVAKHSEGKESLPGAKQVFRANGPDTDVLALRDEDLPGAALLGPAWRDGNRLRDDDLGTVRARAQREIDALPEAWKTVSAPEVVPMPRLSDALKAASDRR
jgi:nicotinate phosphoribosyltransferase